MKPTAWDLARAAQRRWRLALGIGLALATVVTVALWFRMPSSKYTARTLIRVPPESKFLLPTAEPTPELGNHQRTQIALVRSRLVLNAALKRPKVPQLTLLQQEPDPLDWLEKHLEIDFSVAPEILRIALSGDHPEELAIVVNGIRDAYQQEIVDQERNTRAERLEMLGQLRDKFEGQLRSRKAEQRKLEQKAGSHDAGARALVLAFAQQELSLTERDLLQTIADLRRAKIELASRQVYSFKAASATAVANAVLTAGGPFGPGPWSAVPGFFAVDDSSSADALVSEKQVEDELVKDPAIQPFLADAKWLDYLIAETLRSSARGEKDPAVLQYRRKLEARQTEMNSIRITVRPQIKARLQEQARLEQLATRRALERKVHFLEDNKAALEKEVTRLRSRIQDLATYSIKLDEFREDLTQIEELTKRVVSEEESLKVELQAPRRVKVLEEAVVSRQDNLIKRFTTSFGGGLGTLGMVFFAISWWEYRARRVEKPEDVVYELGMKLYGCIPDMSPPILGRKGNWERYSQQAVAESIATIRTLLLEADTRTTLQVIMVTSALPGEGKTSLATRLAASLANVGHQTLYLDGDLRNPMGHVAFGVDNGTGFCEYLRGEATMEDIIRPTAIEGLAFISGGSWDYQVSRHLSNGKVSVLLGYLRQHYDQIVIDSSPVLPVVDPLIIGKKVDAVLLSVLVNHSRLINIHSTLERLNDLGICPLGAIVNGARDLPYLSADNCYYRTSA